MSWFDASNFANLAKNALKEAQKTLDKALADEEDDEVPPDESGHDDSVTEAQVVGDTVIQAEPKGSNNTLWESFAIPFFEKSKLSNNNAELAASSSEYVITKEPRSESTSSAELTRQSVFLAEKDQASAAKSSCSLGDDDNQVELVNYESDQKLTVSSDSLEVLGSASTISPDTEVSLSRVRNSSSSIEVLTSSSIEVLRNAEHDAPNRFQTESTSSESAEIIPNIEEDTDDNLSVNGGTEDTSISESILTVLDSNRLLRSSSSIDMSMTDVLSSRGSGHAKAVSDVSESSQSSLIEFTSETVQEPKLPFMRTRNELSGTSVNTLDSSSCDEGTMIGSSSDEAPKECTSSVCSLKSMLADAINEQADEWTNRGSSPTTSSVESRQDHVKIGSSGHTSADELETATSSDIEIISSPNCDSSNASRQSPAKLIYKNSKGKMSVVLCSDVLVPEITGRSLTFKMKSHNREPSEASSGGSEESLEVDKLLKKIAELNEIIDVRENKLVDLSMKNAELCESNVNLKNQLECQMSEEFTQRLAALEKKFQLAIREKEALRKQLENVKNSDASEFDEDKDEIIRELRAEGEKLSKQQLQSNVLIKKLRATEKENLKLIFSLREQYDGLMQEVERAKKSLSAKEELERSQIEAINQLTKTNQKMKKEAQGLQSQVNNLTSTLVSSQKEIEEKNEKISDLERRLEEVSSLAAQEVLQKVESELLEERRRREKLEFSLSSLQVSLQNSDAQHSERDAMLRKENQKLLNTLEEYKRKNEKLSEEMLNSTKPIVKQLENEINKSNMAAILWEKQERDYLTTISDLQDQLKLLSDNEQKLKERLQSTEEELKEMKSKFKSLQSSVDEKESQLKFQLKLNDLQKEQNDNSLAEKNEEIKRLQIQLEEIQKQKSEERPRNINEMYKDRSKLKFLLQGDMVSGNESDSDISMLSPSPSPQPSDGSNTWLAQLDEDPGTSSSQKGSVYDGSSRPITTATSAIENLQTQYKLKEGEVQQLQWELKKHDHERIILTNEITLLASKVEELEKRLTAHTELQTRYDALLQMYGEKMEECQELKLDLEDVKEMYKIQIDELLTRSRSG